MNKCKVRFVCVLATSPCEFQEKKNRDWVCDYYDKGCSCTNKEAQIKSLQDEGFEIKED